jgi:hypothetical protein
MSHGYQLLVVGVRGCGGITSARRLLIALMRSIQPWKGVAGCPPATLTVPLNGSPSARDSSKTNGKAFPAIPGPSAACRGLDAIASPLTTWAAGRAARFPLIRCHLRTVWQGAAAASVGEVP